MPCLTEPARQRVSSTITASSRFLAAGCQASQAAVGAGLLVTVAGLAGQGERGGVAGAGLLVLAGGQQGFPGTVECLGLAAAVTYLPEQLQRLLVVGGSLVMVALPMAD